MLDLRRINELMGQPFVDSEELVTLFLKVDRDDLFGTRDLLKEMNIVSRVARLDSTGLFIKVPRYRLESIRQWLSENDIEHDEPTTVMEVSLQEDAPVSVDDVHLMQITGATKVGTPVTTDYGVLYHLENANFRGDLLPDCVLVLDAEYFALKVGESLLVYVGDATNIADAWRSGADWEETTSEDK